MTGMTIETEITQMFGIKYPIILAGMNKAAGPKLAAAISNAGGLGVIGGVNYTPRMLKLTIGVLKKHLNDKNAPFGVDLLLPKVGQGARATNYDYTKGHLDELIDIIIESGATLFVSAVGVPPKHVVEKLHNHGVYVMNMVGAPKHVKYACEVGADIICAQGGEGGGHTGDVPTSLLIPKCVDLASQYTSPLTGRPVNVVAAGGIYDGRGLASVLCMGASAVWVGTRLVASIESGASQRHKEAVVAAGYTDTYRSLAYTGRPLRIIKNPYADLWEGARKKEMERLLKKGIVPVDHDQAMNRKRLAAAKSGSQTKKRLQREHADAVDRFFPLLSGQVAGAIDSIKPAKQIVDEMMAEAVEILSRVRKLVKPLPRSKL